jgi:hypothetical protein
MSGIGGLVHASENAIVTISPRATTAATIILGCGRSYGDVRRLQARKHAFHHGLDLFLVESHENFVLDDPSELTDQTDQSDH